LGVVTGVTIYFLILCLALPCVCCCAKKLYIVDQDFSDQILLTPPPPPHEPLQKEKGAETSDVILAKQYGPTSKANPVAAAMRDFEEKGATIAEELIAHKDSGGKMTERRSSRASLGSRDPTQPSEIPTGPSFEPTVENGAGMAAKIGSASDALGTAPRPEREVAKFGTKSEVASKANSSSKSARSKAPSAPVQKGSTGSMGKGVPSTKASQRSATRSHKVPSRKPAAPGDAPKEDAGKSRMSEKTSSARTGSCGSDRPTADQAYEQQQALKKRRDDAVSAATRIRTVTSPQQAEADGSKQLPPKSEDDGDSDSSLG